MTIIIIIIKSCLKLLWRSTIDKLGSVNKTVKSQREENIDERRLEDSEGEEVDLRPRVDCARNIMVLKRIGLIL